MIRAFRGRRVPPLNAFRLLSKDVANRAIFTTVLVDAHAPRATIPKISGLCFARKRFDLFISNGF